MDTMINITKEEMEEFSRIEKIITDTKEMYLFFSNSTEDEIISLCWNGQIMSEKPYMKLFEMACYTNKPKVVQNFLTKEYTSEENNKLMSVDLDFLFLTNAIDKAIIAENFNIIDIIFNHLKLRKSHPISKLNSYDKKTNFYIYSIFKKFLENDNLFLINNQISLYNKINFEDKISLLNRAIKHRSKKTFKFLISDLKKEKEFEPYFNSVFESCFYEKKKELFYIFIEEMNFSCEDNFSYFIKSLFSSSIISDNDYKLQYIENNSNINELFTYDIFLDNFDNIKFKNISIIIKVINIPNIKKHINLEWIDNNFYHENDKKAVKNFLNISNF